MKNITCDQWGIKDTIYENVKKEVEKYIKKHGINNIIEIDVVLHFTRYTITATTRERKTKSLWKKKSTTKKRNKT